MVLALPTQVSYNDHEADAFMGGRTMIYEIQSNIVMENQWATIAIANTDAKVQYITDLQTGKNIVGDPVAFFALVAKDKQTEMWASSNGNL